MKSLTGVIVGVLVVILVIVGVLQYQRNSIPQKEDTTKGIIYFGITDATDAIVDVNDIQLTVTKVEVYSDTTGWNTIASSNISYQLLALNKSGTTQLYAKANVEAGVYSKIRATLGDTIVQTKSRGDVVAVMPSSQVMIDAAVVVRAQSNSHVTLDFLADQSIHITTKGEYIFAPVVALESKSNVTIAVGNDNTMTISGGTIDATANIGVDLDGASKENFKLMTDETLKLESIVDISL